MANISSLAKIADPETFDMVMKAAAQLMIQINIPEHYLSPVQDPPPKDHSRRTPVPAGKSPPPQPLSLTQEPQYRPTRLLAAVVWAPSQMQVFQWRHCQGGLHYVKTVIG